jgi:hypothetical protein
VQRPSAVVVEAVRQVNGSQQGHGARWGAVTVEGAAVGVPGEEPVGVGDTADEPPVGTPVDVEAVESAQANPFADGAHLSAVFTPRGPRSCVHEDNSNDGGAQVTAEPPHRFIDVGAGVLAALGPDADERLALPCSTPHWSPLPVTSRTRTSAATTYDSPQ